MNDQINSHYKGDPYQFISDLIDRYNASEDDSESEACIETIKTFRATWQINRIYRKIILPKRSTITEDLIVFFLFNRFYIFDGFEWFPALSPIRIADYEILNIDEAMEGLIKAHVTFLVLSASEEKLQKYRTLAAEYDAGRSQEIQSKLLRLNAETGVLIYDLPKVNPEYTKGMQSFDSYYESMAGSKIMDDKIQSLAHKNDTSQEEPDNFGLKESNPIPVSSIPASYKYLRSLRTKGGEGIRFRRIGSIFVENIPNPIDAYEITKSDGSRIELFINPYREEDSKRAPEGFCLE